jgi:sulfur dioxygenase
MIFRQLFEPLSSTYTYLLGCGDTGQAVLIDPAMPEWQRDLAVVNGLGLKLALTIETHVHADHITSALHLKRESGCRIAYPAMSRLECADVAVEEGRPLKFGSVQLDPLFTPGHTDDHFSYHAKGCVFTGDALLIDGCGRTDFQNGDAATLYRSVHEKLFALPDDTLVYPAHDYNHRHVSTVAQERERNPRLGGGRPLAEFITIMHELKLAYPKFIDHAVPGNRRCGVCPDDLDEQLRRYCENMSRSPQG